MQQRRLRLGDTLDDYCPRERRVTNHAIVAMVEQDVKQTRCTTCDAEHEYKGARVPVIRRKKDGGALVGGASADALRARRPLADELLADDSLPEDALLDEPLPEPAVLDASADAADDSLVAAALEALGHIEDDADADADADAAQGEDDGPVHRRLIRATLPRVEGQAQQEWKEPEFTVRQPGSRGRETDGNRPGGGGGQGRRPQQRWSGAPARGGDGGQGHRGPGAPHGQRARSNQPQAHSGQGPSGQRPQGQPGPRQAGQQRHSGQQPSGQARPGAGSNHPHGRKRGR